MNFPTTYEEALANYPSQVIEVIASLRKGRSKHRLAAPETLTWSYELGVRVQGISPRDLFNGKAQAERLRQQNRTEQEEIDELRSNCIISLQAAIGRACPWARIPHTSLPEPVRQWTTESVKEKRARQAEADALTPDERAQAISQALQELPGLLYFKIKRPTP